MDVSPKTLREVEFREKMRGYHPEDVDQFLERVAAGIEVLQDRLRQAIERAQRAEQAATEAGGNDDALRRTLLLAQRTADLAVQEAREQAARVVAGAEQQAQALLSDAEQRVHAQVTEAERRAQSLLSDSERRAQSLVGEAEQRARRGHEDALVEVRAELAKLEATRQRLQMDVDAMTRWVAEHRGQLRAALEDALTMVEHIDIAPPPASGVPYPVEAQAPSTPTIVAAVPAASAPAPAPAASAEAPSPAGAVGAPDPWGPPPGPLGTGFPGRTNWSQPDASAWQAPEPEDAVDESGDADPYFAELRRAISDHDPLGPRPESDSQGATGGHSAPGSEA